MNSAIPVYSHSAPETFSARNLSSPARRLCCREIIDVKIMCVRACVRTGVRNYVCACVYVFMCDRETETVRERGGEGEGRVSY